MLRQLEAREIKLGAIFASLGDIIIFLKRKNNVTSFIGGNKNFIVILLHKAQRLAVC